MKKADSYNCHECHTRHSVENMVAYCADCLHNKIKELKNNLVIQGKLLDSYKEQVERLSKEKASRG